MELNNHDASHLPDSPDSQRIHFCCRASERRLFIVADDLGWNDDALSDSEHRTTRQSRNDVHASLCRQPAPFADTGQLADGTPSRSTRHHHAGMPLARGAFEGVGSAQWSLTKQSHNLQKRDEAADTDDTNAFDSAIQQGRAACVPSSCLKTDATSSE